MLTTSTRLAREGQVRGGMQTVASRFASAGPAEFESLR